MTRKNRLAKETSPYLRQHEDNPVDWHPWGPEALEKAKREDKPILLSIGYSACHWCHVMAHESFEDDATAAVMNELYVNVKVDREERPDLDQIYQLAVQIMGRNGGWPLTCFLTPDQKPFFAGTYFPPADRYGMPSFVKVLEAVHDAWKHKRKELLEQADELTDAIVKVPAAESAQGDAVELGPELIVRAGKRMLERFDDKHGGFGQRPKFPNTMGLDILQRTGHDTKVKRALNAMRAGGIWDQLGHGFHRYSTDEKWLVPHFEKMLYDNALLARLYADASRLHGDLRYAEIAHDVLKYVAREMTAPSGAFFATQDADSVPAQHPKGKPEEGAFFVWTRSEVESALPSDPEAVKVAIAHFGITEAGNFEDPHHQAEPGEEARTVLHDSKAIDEIASELGLSFEAAKSARDRAVRGMFHARDLRPRPFRDEKILASWNGLMISACAEVAIATGDTAARAMAERALEAVVASHFREGKLLRTGAIAGYLDDYAFLANAALDLYECTADGKHVELARALVKSAIARFEDRKDGGFFFTPEDGEALITRAKDPFDHAIPSGASMMALALLRLHALDGDPTYEALARKTLEPMASAAANNPLAFGQTVIALDRLVRGSTDVVVVGPRNDPRTQALLDAVKRTFIAHRTLVLVDPEDESTKQAAPALAEGKEMKGHPVAYVCRGRTCSPPIGDAHALAAALRAAL